MEKYQNKYRVPSARANWHDYNGGIYFVTICKKIGNIISGKLRIVGMVCAGVETLRATSLRDVTVVE